MMQQGLRVLAICRSDTAENELIFLGLVGISDPPKDSSIQGIDYSIIVGQKITLVTMIYSLIIN